MSSAGGFKENSPSFTEFRSQYCMVRSSCDHRRGESGFTLVELVVTLLILGVLAALIAPRSPTDQFVLSAASERLKADIRYLQTLSMTQGGRHQMMMTISSSPVTYQFMLTSGVVVAHPVTGNSPATVDAPISVVLGNLPDRVLAFDGLGSPYTNALATTQLTSAASIQLSLNGASRTLTIQPQTGSVQ